MNKTFSLYLDVLRVVAALVVFLSHVGHGHLVGGVLWRFTFWGHEAVMLFFVLSGYVIAYVTDTREGTIKDYAVARLARLYSVIVPAMVLTLLFDALGTRIAPDSYTSGRMMNSNVDPVLSYLLSLLMLNQSWDWVTHFGSNGAYWSIPFEFWYYVLFGVFVFLKGPWRWGTLLVAACVAGPHILILAPVWLLGVLLYRSRHLALGFKQFGGWLLAIAGGLVLLVMLGWDVRHLGVGHFGGLPINSWAWDMLFGGAVCAHLWGLQAALQSSATPNLPRWATVALQRMSGSTLALYLLHLPLIGLLNAMAHHWGKNTFWLWVLLLGPLVFALTVGYRLEQQKHLWRRFFNGLWARWGRA
jgi:peptidoglycan/LPS O-acetylase OafA/YrhL